MFLVGMPLYPDCVNFETGFRAANVIIRIWTFCSDRALPSIAMNYVIQAACGGRFVRCKFSEASLRRLAGRSAFQRVCVDRTPLGELGQRGRSAGAWLRLLSSPFVTQQQLSRVWS
jgi:hypothetical protein